MGVINPEHYIRSQTNSMMLDVDFSSLALILLYIATASSLLGHKQQRQAKHNLGSTHHKTHNKIHVHVCTTLEM